MKRQILLLAITAAALSSCTTAYKTGQTPDDVYFSPARPQDEYVQVKEKDEYRYDDEYYDDRYLRMKVQNRSRWDYLDDWYAYDRYGIRYNQYYGSYSYYGNYYNPYTSWNYYYNPYCRNNGYVYYPKQSYASVNIQKPRSFNLAGYTNTNYNNANNSVRMNSVKPGVISRPVYNNTNSSRSFSNTVKDIFRNNNNSNNSYTPTRTYTPSNSGSSGSSSGSSGSSSSSGASRPTRGGN